MALIVYGRPFTPGLAAWWTAPRTRSFFFGPCFINPQSTPVKFMTIQGGNCICSFGVIWHFDKSEAPAAARVSICHHSDLLHRPIVFKQGTEILFGCLETEVPDENAFHAYPTSLALRARGAMGI